MQLLVTIQANQKLFFCLENKDEQLRELSQSIKKQGLQVVVGQLLQTKVTELYLLQPNMQRLRCPTSTPTDK